MMEVLAVLVFHYFSVSKLTFGIVSILLATSQIQAGWLQHDFGHLSVFFKNRKLNILFHYFTIGMLKAASSHWWNSRHNRHHAKTNVVKHDPDIHTDPLFIWGEEMLKYGNRYLPYQNYYWWFLGPPMVTTGLFVYQNLLFVIKYAHWSDFTCMMLFLGRYFWVYSYYLNGLQLFLLYNSMRFLESQWFTWVTSMSHLPRPVRTQDKRGKENWVSGNLLGTQNMEGGIFNDWFTGHLNYQIEHHLFPTMPRHNYPKVAPMIQELAKQENLPYDRKSLYQACCDIVAKLERVAKYAEKVNKKK